MVRPRPSCCYCEDTGEVPCICALRPVRGHMEDCGWVEEPVDEDEDREPPEELPYDGPMPCDGAEYEF